MLRGAISLEMAPFFMIILVRLSALRASLKTNSNSSIALIRRSNDEHSNYEQSNGTANNLEIYPHPPIPFFVFFPHNRTANTRLLEI